jgi:methionine-rich copper-binding protein CopC
MFVSGQASAQENYDTSVPFQGDVLKELPKPMTITFTTGIHLQDVILTGSDGTKWPLAWNKTEDDVYNVAFEPTKPLPPGKYEIEWIAYVRQHGHPDGGTIGFTFAPEGSAGAREASPAGASTTGAALQAAQDSPAQAPQGAAAPPAGQ